MKYPEAAMSSGDGAGPIRTAPVPISKCFGELVDYWGGDHHDGVPICVLSHGVDDEPEGHARRRLFDGDQAELQLVRSLSDRDVTHLGYRVR
jgi:hypothetical protein